MSENETRDWYPERPPEFRTAGIFQAWIVGTDRPPRPGEQGPSAAAWRVVRFGDLSGMVGVAVSEGPQSEEYRAYVAAAAGVLEMLQSKSKVHVYCRNKAVVDGINEYIHRWDKNGWTRSGGGDIAAKEIWQRFARVRKERDLDVLAEHCRKDERRFDPTFDELADHARRTADSLHPRK